MPNINEELTALLKSNGASLVGFANLKEIAPDVRGGFPNGISIAVSLDPQIMSAIETGPTIAYHAEYKIANALLDYLAYLASQFLEKKGFKARSLLATYEVNRSTLAVKLPHKTVATRAGLGWIGKCALLITRKYGSAIRLTTVLTDAPLSAAQPINASLCEHCVRCIEVCPAKAPTGKNWEAGMRREELYDAFKCRDKARELAMKSFGEPVTICGMCIVACPWTQQYLKKAL